MFFGEGVRKGTRSTAAPTISLFEVCVSQAVSNGPLQKGIVLIGEIEQPVDDIPRISFYMEIAIGFFYEPITQCGALRIVVVVHRTPMITQVDDAGGKKVRCPLL
jgi:hypothetical protein